jgi:hypothetical protein
LLCCKIALCCVARLRDCCIARLRYSCITMLRYCCVARLCDCFYALIKVFTRECTAKYTFCFVVGGVVVVATFNQTWQYFS